MSRGLLRVLAWASILSMALSGVAVAQTTSGVITGTVVDSSGLAVANAAVTLTNSNTGDSRAAASEASGGFVFSSTLAGVYSVAVQANGFKHLAKTNINLTPNERLDLGKMELEVGAVSESVTVVAQGAVVQVDSSERSAELTSTQMADLMTRGRNYTALLKTVPGSVPGANDDRDWFADMSTASISGLSANFNDLTVDGLPSHQPTNPSFITAAVNADAIAEVKVLVNDYQAEYGRNGGAVISSVTKSGTRTYHGSAYTFQRNEDLNANNYFSNLQNLPRPEYRIGSYGGTLGGPVPIRPLKEKLFFFYSEDLAIEALPPSGQQTITTLTMPTALERQGNFSQSLTQAGQLIVITHPTTGNPFPGNVVPANRIDSNGQKMLGLFPLPNFTNTAITKGAYNYLNAETAHDRSRQELFRIDYNVSNKLRVYFRGDTFQWYEDAYGHVSDPAWDELKTRYEELNPSGQFSATFTASPTTMIDFTLGTQYRKELFLPLIQSELQTLEKSRDGITIPQLYPQNNPLGLVPFASFSGISDAPSIGVRGDYPDRDFEPVSTMTSSITKVRGKHIFKAGFYGERDRINRSSTANFAGSLDFSSSTTNPINTGYAFSNAIVGVYNGYTEANSRPNEDMRALTAEWYVQDNWKVTPRLVLDYGARFSWSQPYTQANGVGANFIPSLFSKSQAPVLYQPVLNSAGARVAVNPLNGQLAVASLIGAEVPGAGNPLDGMVQFGAAGIPTGFVNTTGLLFSPRFGFAYNVFGNGKTAIRGGAGIFYEIHDGTTEVNTISNTELKPQFYDGYLSQIGQSGGALVPGSATAIAQFRKSPTVYNYSFGIQQQLFKQTIIDVGYVGNMSRHLFQSRPLNNEPYGYDFLASSTDPTTGKPYPTNFLRPMIGYSTVNYYEADSSSNYNALQVQANRRFAHGIQFQAAWTWSKYMSYSSPPQYNNYRTWGYGLSSNDRTHLLSFNWVYDIPKLSHYYDNRPMRAVFDNWQVSSLEVYRSGTPTGLSYTTTNGADITGGGDGARVILTGPVELGLVPAIQTSSSYQQRRIAAGGFPWERSDCSIPRSWVRELGFCDYQDVPWKEARNVQFRTELYDAFNHTNFSAVNTTANFQPNGAQINGQFGQVTTAADPRRIQFSLRINF